MSFASEKRINPFDVYSIKCLDINKYIIETDTDTDIHKTNEIVKTSHSPHFFLIKCIFPLYERLIENFNIK